MSRAENETYSYIRITASQLVRNGEGTAGGFLVASGTPTIEIFDGIDDTGKVILGPMAVTPATPYPLPVEFQNGLYVKITGTADITLFMA